MSMDFSTSRLSVTELTKHALRTAASQSLCETVPHILSDVVVANLPPYFQGVNDPESAYVWLEKMLSESRLFVVKMHSREQAIGFVFISVDEDGAHIGYLLSETSWGAGLASELLEEFILQAKQGGQWKRLIGGVDSSNSASMHLLEKLGFTTQPQTKNDSVVFYHYPLCSE